MTEVLQECPMDVKKALKDGIKGTSAHKYLAILAHLEKQQLELAGKDDGPIRVEYVIVGG